MNSLLINIVFDHYKIQSFSNIIPYIQIKYIRLLHFEILIYLTLEQLQIG